MDLDLPDVLDHIAVVASKLADARYCPHFDQATSLIVLLWPSESIVFVDQLLPVIDQMRMVLSSPHDANALPLGCHDTHQIRPLWP